MRGAYRGPGDRRLRACARKRTADVGQSVPHATGAGQPERRHPAASSGCDGHPQFRGAAITAPAAPRPATIGGGSHVVAVVQGARGGDHGVAVAVVDRLERCAAAQQQASGLEPLPDPGIGQTVGQYWITTANGSATCEPRTRAARQPRYRVTRGAVAAGPHLNPTCDGDGDSPRTARGGLHARRLDSRSVWEPSHCVVSEGDDLPARREASPTTWSSRSCSTGVRLGRSSSPPAAVGTRLGHT